MLGRSVHAAPINVIRFPPDGNYMHMASGDKSRLFVVRTAFLAAR